MAPWATKSKPQLRARPLRLWHCWRILSSSLNVPEAKFGFTGPRRQMFRTLRRHRRRGPAAALFYGRQLIAVGGLVQTVPGVGEAWSIHSGRISELGIAFLFVRFCRRQLWRWIEEGRYHRVHACISALPDARRAYQFIGWLRALGFTLETRLREADAGRNDTYVYAIWPQRPRATVLPRAVAPECGGAA